MKFLIVLGFIVFFGLAVPALLLWFSRYSKDLMTKGVPFIGFPEDGLDREAMTRETLDSQDDNQPRRHA